ncbi:hypothetical protein [Entomohabitans teleogrylli]|uniref:hypothetical protein n=1 Tax=Entomohabitans teleogrylli TaxID=1384589 RepID=UPI00073D36DA|nr:hypothetical protein [Entomohabitans teleogrylli]
MNRKPSLLCLFVVFTVPSLPVYAADYNQQIITTVEWLARNKSGLGYSLNSRYTEDLKYGDYTFRSTGGTSTMCVAAVFEVLIRTLAMAKDREGNPVSSKLLKGQVLDGSKALNISPYAFQYASLVNIPEYKRKFSAGIGDAFVLFGMGQYVTFKNAKGGDFVYFNRSNGSGHAVILISYLNREGKPSSDAESAIGFRYFSAQKNGTNGMGYRDAFFGSCPKVETTYVKDCGLIKSDKRALFAISRLNDPNEWFTDFSAIRVERYFKGDSIDSITADEDAFRQRAKEELTEAEKKAQVYAKQGKFPLIVTEIGGENDMAKQSLKEVEFDEDAFGPNFAE